MEVYESLIPGSARFERLLDRLCNEIDINDLFVLSDQNSELGTELLQYSIFSEHWRWFEPILMGDASKLEEIAEPDEVNETLSQIVALGQSAISKTSLDLVRRQLMNTAHPRDRLALLPRSLPITLSSVSGAQSRIIDPRSGTAWLKRARHFPRPIHRTERFFCGYLLSLGLLCSHPFQDGNGRLSRILLNTYSPTSDARPFPWSIYLLLRCGSYLYNYLLFTGEDQFESSLTGLLHTLMSESKKNIELIKNVVKPSTSGVDYSAASTSLPCRARHWHKLIHC